MDKHGASSLNVIIVPLWTYVLQGGVPSSLFFSMLKVNSTFLVNSNSINELHVYNDKKAIDPSVESNKLQPSKDQIPHSLLQVASSNNSEDSNLLQ